MTAVATALQAFLGGFGLPVYGENNVPDGAGMPYITCAAAVPEPGGYARARAWVWYPGHAYREAMAARDAIAEALADGGACVQGVYLFDEGAEIVREVGRGCGAVRMTIGIRR